MAGRAATSTLRLYLDENVPVPLASALRRRGFDVATPHDRAMLGATDEAQLALAVEEERTILSHDVADFVILHRVWIASDRAHWGIIVSDPVGVGELTRRLSVLAENVTREDLRSRLVFLGQFAR